MYEPGPYMAPAIPGVSSPWKMDLASLWPEYLEMWEVPLPPPGSAYSCHRDWVLESLKIRCLSRINV